MGWRMQERDRREFGLVGLGNEEVRVGGWMGYLKPAMNGMGEGLL